MPTPEEDRQATLAEEAIIDQQIEEAERAQGLAGAEVPAGSTPPAEKPEEDKKEEEKPQDTPPPEKQATPPEEKKDETPPAQFETSEQLEKRLEEIEVPKDAHPNTVKAIPVLKDVIREKQKELDRLKSIVDKTAEEKKQIKVLTPEIEKNLQELESFRRMFAIEHDPVFKQKYDDKIKAITQESFDLLKQWGTPEPVLKFIADNGGVEEVMFSTAKMPDGKTTREEWFASEIMESMSARQKFEFENRIRNITSLKDEKNQQIKSAQQDSEKWMAERKDEFERSQKNWNERLEKAKAAALKQLGENAQKKDIPLNASAEQKAAIQKHNERIDKAESFYQNAMKASTPEDVAQVGVMAGYGVYTYEVLQETQAQLKAVQEENKKLTDKLDKISKSGRTARESNAPPPSSKPISDNKSLLKSNDETTIDKLIDESERK